MESDACEFEWNDVYAGDASDYVDPDPQLLDLIRSLSPGRALDIGCGAGGLVVALVERGWQVVGVDIAPKAIEAARSVLGERGLQAELEVADAIDWRPTGFFDLITNSFALPASREDQGKLFAAIRKALSPGGIVAIKDFDVSMKRYREFSRFHCPTLEELTAAFDGYNLLRAEVQEASRHEHYEDSREPPTAALLCARKPLR